MTVKHDPKSLREMPEASYSDNVTTGISTGVWKNVQPVYRDALPPCSHLCPAGNDISRVLYLTGAGRLDEAAATLREMNPLPATLGRVCPHPCEKACNRKRTGGAIAVHAIERFLGDHALESGFSPSPAESTGHSVAVVGGGPAGIAAAYNLALRGHAVEVFDQKDAPGGYLRTGIPDYRLPKRILDREIELVEEAGVTFRSGTAVGRDVTFDELRERFDAVILAVGFHKTRPLGVPGDDHERVYNGVRLLEQIILGCAPELPERVAVVGGGNTAMDVARSLLRLGKTPVIAYRRTRKEMPAIEAEVDEALAEGIEMHVLVAPTRVVVEDGELKGLELQRMELGEKDSSGRRRPVPVEGSEFVLDVGGVVTAIGEKADFDFLPESLCDGWRLAADGRLATCEEGVFACGDAESGEGTVTAAVGAGRRVAEMVHRHLGGEELPETPPRLQESWGRDVDLDGGVVTQRRLNMSYYTDQPRPEARHLDAETRSRGFDEVVEGFSQDEAIAEARRCLLCGTCNECGNCLVFCPDAAISKKPDGFGFTIDLDHCKGCGICVEECPRCGIDLEEVAR